MPNKPTLIYVHFKLNYFKIWHPNPFRKFWMTTLNSLMKYYHSSKLILHYYLSFHKFALSFEICFAFLKTFWKSNNNYCEKEFEISLKLYEQEPGEHVAFAFKNIFENRNHGWFNFLITSLPINTMRNYSETVEHFSNIN